jgi:hypothetical protein
MSDKFLKAISSTIKVIESQAPSLEKTLKTSFEKKDFSTVSNTLDYYKNNLIDAITTNLIDLFSSKELQIMKQIFTTTDFLYAPASTRFHHDFSGGLAIHSLQVLYNVLELGDIYNTTFEEIYKPAVLFHDFCKVDMYELQLKWHKENNKWVSEAVFEVRQDYNSLGHGTESLIRLVKAFGFISKEWEQAVYNHMGVYNLNQQDTTNFSKSCRNYKEVLLLHHADMLSTMPWRKYEA